MEKKDDLFEKAFKMLEQDAKPTEQQKDKMLNLILIECRKEKNSGIGYSHSID